jgi:hypothetical protein
MSAFDEQMNQHFAGAVPSGVFLNRVWNATSDLGFTVDNTLPLVSICRDELTTDFFARIQAIWGPAFTLAGLGGVPALGRTGWGAAFSHIPTTDGRGKVLVLGFPHIGIEDDGSVGVTLRSGQTTATPTCGALNAIFESARSGTLPTAIELDDYEETRLALRLVDPAAPPATLVDLTIEALEALEIDLWKALDDARIWEHHDVAVWCGVQIHGHDGADWIWSRDAWTCGSDGQRHPIEHA